MTTETRKVRNGSLGAIVFDGYILGFVYIGPIQILTLLLSRLDFSLLIFPSRAVARAEIGWDTRIVKPDSEGFGEISAGRIFDRSANVVYGNFFTPQEFDRLCESGAHRSCAAGVFQNDK